MSRLLNERSPLVTSRSVPAWEGKTPDTAAPDRVRARVFDRAGGRCHRCERKIGAGESWTLEHLLALSRGGRNAETNLGVTCDWCLPVKNREDAAAKKKIARVRKKHIGALGESKRKIPGSKGTNWKRRVDGTTERRGK